MAVFNREVLGIQNDNDLDVDNKSPKLTQSLKEKKAGKKGKKGKKRDPDDDLVSKTYEKSDSQVALLQLYWQREEQGSLT